MEANFKMLLLSGIFQSYYMNYLNLLDKMEESAEGSEHCSGETYWFTQFC